MGRDASGVHGAGPGRLEFSVDERVPRLGSTHAHDAGKVDRGEGMYAGLAYMLQEAPCLRRNIAHVRSRRV